MLCCSATTFSALFAALVPFTAGLALFLTGTGVLDINAMTTVSRSGGRKELLRGPFVYCVVLVLVTALKWQVTLPGICAVSMMCGGDGFADIIGRRFGKNKLPWNKVKSAEGSVAMFLFGAALSAGYENCLVDTTSRCSRTSGMLLQRSSEVDFFMLRTGLCRLVEYFNAQGLMEVTAQRELPVIVLTSLVCTGIESIPATFIDDNISVPAAAAAFAYMLLNAQV